MIIMGNVCGIARMGPVRIQTKTGCPSLREKERLHPEEEMFKE